MLQAGLFELSKASLRLLKQVSLTTNPNEPGRVIHELATTGVVYNAGNLVETPLFTRAVHQTWLWTGDDAFLREMYPFCKQGLLDYTLGQCDPDGDLCPSGRSIIETLEMHAGFECLDVATYTWEALGRLAEMAQAVADGDLIPELHAKAQILGQRLLSEWWLADEALFADVRASVSEVRQRLQTLDALAQQQPNNAGVQQQVAQAHRFFDPLLASRRTAPPDLDLPWLLRHWVVFCPVEVGLASPAQAAHLLQRLATPEFGNQWGMYLHPDRRDVMSINSGLLALAQTRYGQVDAALTRIQAMAQTLYVHMPGAISEALPDQWCFLQLWSALGIISPLVEGIFGLEPCASERRLRVVVHLPTGWHAAELRQVCVGDAHFTIHASRQSQRYTLTVTTDAPDYALEVGFILPATTQIEQVTLNGQPIAWQWQQRNAGQALVCAAKGDSGLVIDIY
jgi:glycogen debranching enzyme